jgi:hypothetical protein
MSPGPTRGFCYFSTERLNENIGGGVGRSSIMLSMDYELSGLMFLVLSIVCGVDCYKWRNNYSSHMCVWYFSKDKR